MSVLLEPKNDNRGLLKIAFVWALAACVLGPFLASLGFALFDLSVSGMSLGSSFKLPYFVFADGTAGSMAGLLPLTAVLYGYGRRVRRRPEMERSWNTVWGYCALLGWVSAVGWFVIVFVMSILSDEHDWLILLLGLLVAPVATLGLGAARAIVPGLRPGVFLEATGSWRLRSVLVRGVIIAGWLVLLTSATSRVRTNLYLPCEAPASRSCSEEVASYGLPYPYLQRTFDPLAFIYDALVIGVLHLPVVAVVRRRQRSAVVVQ